MEMTGFSRLQVAILLAIAAAFQFGYNTGIISGALLYLPSTFPILRTNAALKSLVATALVLGAAVGALLSSRLNEALGRRRSLQSIHGAFFLSALFLASSVNLAMVVAGRFLVGLCAGATTSVVPTYITEISPAAIRGQSGTLIQFAVTFGVLVSYFVGYGMSFVRVSGEDMSWNWRLMFATGAVFPLLALLASPWLVESPRWLVQRGNVDAARQSLRLLLGPRPSPSATASTTSGTLLALEDSIEEQIQEMQRVMRKPEQDNLLGSDLLPPRSCSSLPQLFTAKYRYALCIAVGMFILQQFSGINVLVYFTATLFEEMGFDKTDALLASAVSSVPQILCLLLVAVFLDRVGRKPLLLASLALMGMGMFALGACLYLPSSLRQSCTLGVIVFVRVTFSLGLGPIPAILASEILPNPVRSKGMGFASFINWIANGIITSTFFNLAEWEKKVRGDGREGVVYIYWTYGGFLVAGFVLVWLFVTETSSRSLEEMETLLDVEGQRSPSVVEQEDGDVLNTACFPENKIEQ